VAASRRTSSHYQLTHRNQCPAVEGGNQEERTQTIPNNAFRIEPPELDLPYISRCDGYLLPKVTTKSRKSTRFDVHRTQPCSEERTVQEETNPQSATANRASIPCVIREVDIFTFPQSRSRTDGRILSILSPPPIQTQLGLGVHRRKKNPYCSTLTIINRELWYCRCPPLFESREIRVGKTGRRKRQ
jgi:hypothetical protein